MHAILLVIIYYLGLCSLFMASFIDAVQQLTWHSVQIEYTLEAVWTAMVPLNFYYALAGPILLFCFVFFIKETIRASFMALLRQCP